MDRRFEPIALEFGRRIREARESKGMSKKALADASGLDRSTIRAAEAGRREMNSVTLQLIILGLGVGSDEIIGGIEWIPATTPDSSGAFRIEPPSRRGD